MTISLTPSFSDLAKDAPIRPRILAYLRGQLRNALHELILMEFVRQENVGALTRAKLARRTGKGADQVTRWLGAPGNWTLDTVSDLLAGMGAKLQLSIVPLVDSRIEAAQSSATSVVAARDDEDEERYDIAASSETHFDSAPILQLSAT